MREGFAAGQNLLYVGPMTTSDQQASDRPGLGIGLMLATTLVFAFQDAMTKTLSTEFSAAQILMVRFWVVLVYALIFMRIRGRPLRRCFESKRPWLQITRSLLLIVEIGVFILALRTLSLAEAHSLMATFPLMVTALSVPLLGEQVGLRRWAAVGIGFLGVLIILRPGMGVIDAGAIYGLAAAALFALYNVLTRLASRTDSSDTAFFYLAVTGFVVCTAVGPFFWQPLALNDWLMMGAIGLTSSISHMMLILALQYAAASVLQPFNYMLLVWATLIGYLWFGDFPDTWTIAGALVVVGSGLYTIYRERIRTGRVRVVATGSDAEVMTRKR